jgi:hypothetical protein
MLPAGPAQLFNYASAAILLANSILLADLF